MSAFLEIVAHRLLQNHSSFEQIAVVLPSQRAKVHLRSILTRLLQARNQTAWMPEMLDPGECMRRIANGQPLDGLQSLIAAYRVYAKTIDAEHTFDAFIGWAPILLADFNAVEKYDLNGEAVFQNLEDIREIEQWSFQDEALTEIQQAFSDRWRAMRTFYQHWRQDQTEQQLWSAGRMGREAARMVMENRAHLPWKHVYIAGLNALSTTERNVYFTLEDRGKATLMWDADQSWLDDPLNEAGLFLRRYQRGMKRSLGLENSGHQGLDVIKHQTVTRVAQVQVLRKLLEQEGTTWERTAVVLADESLLIPVLGAMPEGAFNVTLGYPLHLTPAFDLLEKLQEIRFRVRNRSGNLWHHDMRLLVRHPVTAQAVGAHLERSEAFLQELEINNQAYETVDVFSEHVEADWLKCVSNYLLAPADDASAQVHQLAGFVQALLDAFPTNLRAEARLHREALFLLRKALRQLERHLEDIPGQVGERGWQFIFRHLVRQEQLNFRGEPLDGLQIMGMLETRALHFERVIVLGANEGHMPRTGFEQSFIPFDLKKAHGLPTRRERDAIYAYYFFRLVRKAKRVDFIYTSQSEDMGSTEPSRYIGQLDQLLAGRKVPPVAYQQPMELNAEQPLELRQSQEAEAAIRSVLQRGISTSSLSTFVRCPLDFYMKYVLGFREPSGLEESVDQALFGTLVHDMLEYLYRGEHSGDGPIGRTLTVDFLNGCIKQLPDLGSYVLKHRRLPHWSDQQPTPAMRQGMNRLIFNTAIAYVERFLRWELSESRKTPAELLYLESSFSAPLAIPERRGVQEVTFRGKVDRIDRVGDTLRIIDYKTGLIDHKKLKMPEDAAELAGPEAYHVRQLLVYDVITTGAAWRGEAPVCPGMISLRKLSLGAQYVVKSGDQPAAFQPIHLARFGEAVALLVDQMLDPERTWAHQPESQFCAYCPD